MADVGVVDPEAARIAADLGGRLLDRQLVIYQDLVTRSGSLMRLGLAELAGVVAIIGFSADRQAVGGWAAGALGLGGALAVIAIFLSIRPAVGTLRDLTLNLGPGLERFRERVSAGHSSTEILLTIVATDHASSTENAQLIRRASRTLVVASYLLGTSVPLFLGGLLYVFLQVIP